MNQIILEDYLQPFDNMDQLLKAMFCYYKMKHYSTLNLNLIRECILVTTNKNISYDNFKCFIDKITFHSNLYPNSMFKSLSQYDVLSIDLDNYINSHNYASREFEYLLTNCVTCKLALDRTKCGIYQDAIVFYSCKQASRCFNKYIICTHCKTLHFYSYYVTNLNQRYFYNNVFDNEFISFTNQTIYEKKIFTMFLSDLHFKHSSFKAFCNSYNSMFTNHNINRNMSRQRLTECFFYFHLLLFKKEIGDLSNFVAPYIENIDLELSNIRDDLLKIFVKKWSGKEHQNNCKHPNCSKLLNIDGNWKITRQKCGYEDIYINSTEVKYPIKTGCRLSPVDGSYYCKKHYIEEPVLSFYINNQYQTYRIKSIVEANIMFHSRKIKKIHDVYYKEEECLTENNEEENLLYLVESVENSKDNFFWLKKKNIPDDVYKSYLLDLAMREKLDIYNEVSCNTNKHFKTPFTKKFRTKG